LCRGQGVAGTLLISVVDWARGDGAQVLTLWVVDGNEPATRLCRRHGFLPTGERQLAPDSVSVVGSKMEFRLAACG
jgi:GNAT superfamily N-acetyltransferase